MPQNVDFIIIILIDEGLLENRDLAFFHFVFPVIQGERHILDALLNAMN